MPKKVLIVDDEPNIVISLEFLLEQAGYAVQVARTGLEALHLTGSFGPDLILLDVMLPGLNGYEVLQKLRENPYHQHIKIIMLTAKGREVEMTKGLELGANAYVTKPFSTRELLQKVQQYLRDDV